MVFTITLTFSTGNPLSNFKEFFRKKWADIADIGKNCPSDPGSPVPVLKLEDTKLNIEINMKDVRSELKKKKKDKESSVKKAKEARKEAKKQEKKDIINRASIDALGIEKNKKKN